MVWRDLDLQVLSPGLSAAETWEMVRPLAAHPQVHEVRFLNQAGANSFSGDPRDSGHYFRILYRTIQGDDWKLDVSLSVSAPIGEPAAFFKREPPGRGGVPPGAGRAGTAPWGGYTRTGGPIRRTERHDERGRDAGEGPAVVRVQ